METTVTHHTSWLESTGECVVRQNQAGVSTNGALASNLNDRKDSMTTIQFADLVSGWVGD